MHLVDRQPCSVCLWLLCWKSTCVRRPVHIMLPIQLATKEDELGVNFGVSTAHFKSRLHICRCCYACAYLYSFRFFVCFEHSACGTASVLHRNPARFVLTCLHTHCFFSVLFFVRIRGSYLVVTIHFLDFVCLLKSGTCLSRVRWSLHR